MIADQMMTEFETPSNPFPGLRPFEFDESLLYFGRDGQSEQLLRKLVAARFMAVVGSSGSGKSSLVRAGLLPALFGGFMTSADSDWHIAIFRPSNDPVGNLSRAISDSGLFGSPAEENAEFQATMIESTLRRGSLGLVEAVRLAQIGPSDHVLVVVDQFEELFRFAKVAEGERYQNDAAAFVKLLLEASRQREIPIYIVLTMRSDFLGDCSLFWDLPEALNEGQYLIPRLTRDQRREAITGPAAVCGAALTPRLINRLLNDMGDNPDQLPILQHALMRTWNRWREENQESEPIDLQHYEAIGEMRAALSRHADEAYNELTDDRSRAIAEKMFKGLTEKGTDNREIRRPMELRDLCALTEATEAEVIAVIDVFRREGRSFLMPPAETRLGGNSLIDISHESLIRNWERLKAWVDEEARSARIYRRLTETSVLHQKGEAGLYRDPDLQLALDWREGSRPNKTWARRYYPEFDAAMTFLDQSREAWDREARDREAHRRKEIKRTRLTAIIFAFAFLSSLGALAYANNKKVEANESKAKLEVALEDANNQRNMAIEQTVIAGKERLRAEKEADYALNESEAAVRATKKAQEQEQIAAENAALAEAATRKAREETKRAEEETSKAETEAERSRQLLYAANINLAQDAYYEENIQRAQTLLEDDSTKYEDLRGFEWGYLNWLYHREAGTLDGGHGEIKDVEFSPDNKYMATAGNHSVKLWDTSSRRELHSIPTNDAPVGALAFSPNGKLLAYGGEDSAVRLHRIGETEAADVLRGDGQPITSLLFSRDGKTLIAGSGGERDLGGVKIWDVDLRQQRFDVPDIKEAVRAIALSPDQKTLAIARANHPLILFDIDSRKADSITEIHYVMSVAFSPDGKTIIAGISGGSSFVLFDVKGKKTLATLEGFSRNEFFFRPGGGIAVSPDGKTFAVGLNNTLRLYDAVNLGSSTPPRLITPLLGQVFQIFSLSFSSDGKTVAANDDESVRFWDATAPRDSAALAKDSLVGKTFFSTDNKTVSMINEEETLFKTWDAASQQELSMPPKFAQELRGLAYSPGGRFLATINGARSDTINLWDIASRSLIATLSEDLTRSKTTVEFIRSVAVSPDGKTLAAINIIEKAEVESDEMEKCVLKLWNTDSPREPVILKSETNCAKPSIEFSPDGRTLACLGKFGQGPTVKLWDVASRKEGSLDYGEGSISDERIFFSPDGSKIVFTGIIPHAGAQTLTELWDTHSKKRVETLASGHDYLHGVFSPDGKVFAGALTSDQTPIVTLWDTQTGKFLTTFEGYTDSVSCMAFSPDGKNFATGSQDGLVKLWSVASRRLLITLYEENKEAFTSLSFSPDSRMLITGSASGSVRLWPAAPANAIEK